ncbi:MAG: long-chain fatty acid--CoA ligase [Bacteroidetes bacterium HGW-Bacteroidetes-11]|jgi:long-chain acyl-CoA synthetase|nr:MAG: long-chain fatty acid--CoA ligase [Bacteroidetes bacterium HGW-Bacteroidetes-11]
MTQVTRLFDLLPHYAEKYRIKDDVLAGKENGIWTTYSIAEYREMADNISYALINAGIVRGDMVATIMPSRPEWNIIDMGIMQAGAIHVPIYPTISEADYKFILNHAEVKIVFISGKEIFRKIEHILPEIKSMKAVYAVKETAGTEKFLDFIETGKKNSNPELLKSIKASINENDLATVIYTSGTTGNPKGVMLTHANLLSNVKAVVHIPPFGEEGKALSYLPLCHVYERMLNYMYQYLGISVYYAENVASIAENMRDVKPEILSTVPRLLEKIYDKIVANGRKLTGIKKFLFFWALNLGLRYELNGANGWYYEAKLKLANKIIFSKWRAALGNKMQVIVSGGAALQPRLARVFSAAQIPVLEGYGLTETSPVLSVNDFSPDGICFGTVGKVLKGVEVMIADDGEILAKGPNLMLGYYKEPALTAEAIDPEGWFHTGDIGRFEPAGHLRITGRKKEIFKTSLGKYISPEQLENRFKESSFIDALIIIGENQKYAAALIVPDFNHLKNWCAIKEIPYTSDSEMVELPRIKKRFQLEIDKYNKFFGATEQVKRIEILDKEWTVDSGELTASMKLRRRFIMQKYSDLINKIFNISEE